MANPDMDGNRVNMPSATGLVSGTLVVAGILLYMFAAKALLIVAGIGVFGPGILLELGWLRDQDEFQRQAAWRAGYHAYLAGGLATVVIISGLSWLQFYSGSTRDWMMLLLVLSWLFSALLSYWGATKTTSRMLRVCGSFWAVFILADLVDSVQSGHSGLAILAGFAVGAFIVGVFFGLAWAASRFPAWTAGGLLGATGIFTWKFAGASNLPLSTVLVTLTLLVLPLLASAIALARESRRSASTVSDSA